MIDAVAPATRLEAMRAAAERYAPRGGTGFWERDAAFLDSGGTGKRLSDADLELYATRISQLVPNGRARRWLKSGGTRFQPAD